jgi:hypothetical protein
MQVYKKLKNKIKAIPIIYIGIIKKLNKMAILLVLSNGHHSTYEIKNITLKKEKFMIVFAIEQIIYELNKRYSTKEDDIIIAKIINLETDDQCTIQYCQNSLNNGFTVKKSNVNNSIVYNTDCKNSLPVMSTQNIFPITKPFLEDIFTKLNISFF